jgi:hypothetical protein
LRRGIVELNQSEYRRRRRGRAVRRHEFVMLLAASK